MSSVSPAQNPSSFLPWPHLLCPAGILSIRPLLGYRCKAWPRTGEVGAAQPKGLSSSSLTHTRRLSVSPGPPCQDTCSSSLKFQHEGLLGGSAVERLPSAQGVILETQDRVPHQAPCMEPASPSACVSAYLCVSHE